MACKKNIKKLLSKMTNDMDYNIKKISKAFDGLDYKDEDNQSILHIFVDQKYDEEQCFLAIKALLQAGLSPNLKDDFDYIFIQTALYAGYSEEFILKIIKEALNYNLNVNHVDSDKDTIMHTAIYSDYYIQDVDKIYDLLCDNGFNSNLKDHTSRNLLDAIIFQKQYTKEQIETFRKKFLPRYTLGTEKTVYKDDKPKQVKKEIPKPKPIVYDVTKKYPSEFIRKLEKFGYILNKTKRVVEPTIGREKELKSLMITLAQDKKRPLLVGESGVGKTSIVDELVYRIQIGDVPNFLKDRMILEINPSELVAGCQFVGTFEDKLAEIMQICKRYNIIIFIDEIHTMFGTASTINNDNDMASMMKYYIDRSGVLVIGTTTENEYTKYFSNDALKRRFEKIIIKEPTIDTLYTIVNKVLDDYSIKNNLALKNEKIKPYIINILLETTEKNHRVYNDRINNPDLVISIIDKAFAYAKVYSDKYITIEHFIESIENCDRIYDTAKNKAIESLLNIDNDMNSEIQKSNGRVLKIDFNNRKK